MACFTRDYWVSTREFEVVGYSRIGVVESMDFLLERLSVC